MKIYLARKQGFCSGVARAIQAVNKALDEYGPPLYVYHEIVHNTFVVEYFRDHGVVFVEDLADVPEGSRLIFSAHGISPSVIETAETRHLQWIDASCPLVKKVHTEAMDFVREGRHVLLVGHPGHQEIIGTAGYVPPDKLTIIQTLSDIAGLDLPDTTPVAYLTQTTLSIDETHDLIAALRDRFSNLKGPDQKDICFATQSRQDAVKELAAVSEAILICGSPNSSNSNRLRETGERAGVPSYIIDSAAELDFSWLTPIERLGISSGASVPHCVVQEVINEIKKRVPNVTVTALTGFKVPDNFPNSP